MKKNKSLFYHITIFVITQLLWLMVLGLWIYWYVDNYIIIKRAGDALPQIKIDSPNVFVLVGGIILLVAISFAITLIFKNLNVQLKLNKLYDNFIGNITHELKSPLSSITLYLETLKSRDVPKAKQEEFIAIMLKDATRLKNLINTILEVSALEQKKLAHSYHVYNAGKILKQLFEESAEQFKVRQGNYHIKIECQGRCVIDRNALKIVFDNLVDNALKYSPEQVDISVIITNIANKIVIDFEDKGIGIAFEEQKNVFQKFHRIYNKEIPSVKGTGLGLYWVKEIIKAHGGKISVRSDGINKGAIFRIILPVYGKSNKRYIRNLLEDTNKRESQLV